MSFTLTCDSCSWQVDFLVQVNADMGIGVDLIYSEQGNWKSAVIPADVRRSLVKLPAAEIFFSKGYVAVSRAFLLL